MSVRRRTWTNADGSQGEAWVVNYTDADGKRRLKSFARKRDADAYHAKVAVDVGPAQAAQLGAARTGEDCGQQEWAPAARQVGNDAADLVRGGDVDPDLEPALVAPFGVGVTIAPPVPP